MIRKIRRSLWMFWRYLFFLLTNLIFWPFFIFPLAWLANKARRPLFGFIFMVYPGRLEHVKSYGPLWWRRFFSPINVVGFIFNHRPGQPRGLIVSAPWTMEELEGNLELARNVFGKTAEWAGLLGVKVVAPGGRLPKILKKKLNFENLAPFIVGDKGTIFTIVSVVEAALAKNKLELSKIKIGVLGYGFFGAKVADFFRSKTTVVAVDPRAEREISEDKFILSREAKPLRDVDLLIVLTAAGRQLEGAIDFLKSGTIVVDDTHPAVPRDLIKRLQQKNCPVIKAALGLKEISFWPPLPGWQKKEVPGCCVEALVVLKENLPEQATQEEFNLAASQLGFETILPNQSS